MRTTCFVIIICSVLSSCWSEHEAQPRPRQYPKVNFPEKNYTKTTLADCDFSIEVPDYSKTEKKTYFFDEDPGHPCWFDLVFEPFNATLHLSYYPVGTQKDLDELVNDAFVMAGKHNVRATFRDEQQFSTNDGSSGLIFKIDGPVATPYQFYITDNEMHFLRGSLYFNEKMQRDSLQVIIDFLQDDIDHLIQTLEWK